MKKYLVGGAVRDMLLGRAPREHDVTFEGSASDFLQSYPETRKVGKRIDVYLLHGIEYRPIHPDGLAADLAMRDLTINALALEESGILHAHPQALTDLKNKILRPASPEAFRRDPLRIFRVARFAAQLPGFEVAEETFKAMREVCASGLLANLPGEQVCRETIKALGAPAPSRFISILAEAACLEPWFSELATADSIPAGPATYHSGSVLAHTGEIMDRLAGNPLRVWMALCHDLGKTTTARELLPRHHGHDRRGAPLAVTLGKRLTMPNRYIRAGELASRLHMKGAAYDALRPNTRVDLLHELHVAEIFVPFWELVHADMRSPAPLSERSRHPDQDLECMLAVRLEPEECNLGAASGQRLRELRCRALAHRD